MNIVMNNGIGVACIVYFMWYNNSTMKDFITALSNINETLNNVNTRLSIIETEIQKRDINEK